MPEETIASKNTGALAPNYCDMHLLITVLGTKNKVRVVFLDARQALSTVCVSPVIKYHVLHGIVASHGGLMLRGISTRVGVDICIERMRNPALGRACHHGQRKKLILRAGC